MTPSLSIQIGKNVPRGLLSANYLFQQLGRTVTASQAQVAPALQRSILQQRQKQRTKAVQTAPDFVKAAAPSSTVSYDVSVILQGARDPVCLYLTVVSENDPSLLSDKYDLSEGQAVPYKRDDLTQAGTQVSLKIQLPDKFKPGVILLNKFAEPDEKDETAPFVASIVLAPSGGGPAVAYAAYTYVQIDQGDRVIFPATPAYPGFHKATPKGLEGYRQKELAAFRGTAEDAKTKRTGQAERIYQFDIYNDLGDEKNSRNSLGGTSSFPYPRRLRTGRGQKDGKEERPPGNELPWLPIDEHFNSVKNYAFNGDTNDAGGRAIRSVLGTPRGISLVLSLIPFINKMYEKTARNIFTNMHVIDALYDGLVDGDENEEHIFQELLPVARLKTVEILDLLQSRWSKMDDGLKKAFGLLVPAKDIDDVIQKKKVSTDDSVNASHEAAKRGGWLGKIFSINQPVQKEVGSLSLGEKVDDAVGIIAGLLEKWPTPGVRQDRALQWRSDEEFGRSALAGQNPLSIRAVKAKELAKLTIKDQHVDSLLEGLSLEKSVAAGRLWILDYYDGYKQYMKAVSDLKDSESVLYAGRCLLFTRSNGATVPVAIELEAQGSPMRVFTPKGPAEVWQLAKTVISSLDSGIHQLISHWLRTHACVEPYIIATRRELSLLNPVYKLLKPHFRYTLRINSNARKALISAGGIVEQCFTPGPFSMELSSVVYQKWRFNEQSLPQDLLKRGVATVEKGKLKIKIPNYPYAEDGLLLWNSIVQFVGDYLRVYYDDNVEGRKVTDDEEVKAWWACIQNEGHPDITDGWPKITNIDSLRDILASIMWTASCHHAAVNFGQYDNSGYMPYKPTKIIAKIPEAGSDQEQELKNRFESSLLKSISDPKSALAVMVTVKILSAHAADEEYLDREVHSYIKDAEGTQIHKKFVKAVNDAEKEIDVRNQSPKRLGNGEGMPYKLLLPSNKDFSILPGARPSGRGVPYSISI